MNGSIILGFVIGCTLLTSGARAEPSSHQNNKQTKRIQVSPAEIARNPQQFYGKSVQVSTTVKEVYNRNTLGLVGADPSSPEAALNVIIPYRSTASVIEGDKITVVGTVRRFDPEQLKQEFQWFTTSWFDRPNMIAHWPFKPVIIAGSVRTPSGANLVQRAPEDAPGLKPKEEPPVQPTR